MNNRCFYMLAFSSAFLPATPLMAGGGAVPINYDALSFLEEPLATDLGGVTVSGNVLLDQSVSYQHNDAEDTSNSRAIGQVTVETQLPNSWRIGLQYVGNYSLERADEYQDDVALFVADEWGTLAGGNVTGSVFENTRRVRGVGNASLANANFLGGLDQWGAFYSVRYNAYVASAAADAEGNAEIGLSYERPIGRASYFLSGRARMADMGESSSGIAGDQTLGAAFVAAYTYASTRVDGQILFEQIEDFANSGEDEHFVSGNVGLFHQFGAYLFSLEGGLAELAGNDLYSGALGARFDLARSASLNMGVNYSNPNQKSQVTSIGSVRYEF